MRIITGSRRSRPSQSERFLAERRAGRESASVAASSPSSFPASSPSRRFSPAPVSVARSPTPAAASDLSLDPDDPPKKRKRPKKALTPWEKRKRYLVWGFWILVVLSLYFSFGWVKEQLFVLLQMNPAVWAVYKAIELEIASRSLLGLFYASFFGALFFITLPVELIFLYYLGLNYYFVQVLVITLAGNLLGIALDYFVGWLIGTRILKWFLKEKYDGFHRKIEKAGAFIVIIGNIIPFPIEPFTVFLGAVRYGFFRLMLYTFLGKLVKFGLLWLGYKYFVQYVGPYLGTVNLPWFLNLVKSSFGG